MKNKLLREKVLNSIYTDLAIEAKEVLEEAFPEDEIDGVIVDEILYDNDKIKVVNVQIINEEGEALLGKTKGNYITMEIENLGTGTKEDHKNVTKVLVKYIKELCNMDNVEKVLVVGLGNEEVSADSLGPKILRKTLVTRHIIDNIPKDLASKLKIVSGITPGVMGQTGIETVETVKGIVKKIKPDLIIAIDALAARKANRLNTTIQLSDTGIIPGSGVNNKRKGLNIETLGVPVVAIGVPTVISATSMVNDTIDLILEKLELKDVVLANMPDEDRLNLVNKIVVPYVGELYVTPKEINFSIDRLTSIISNSINMSMHNELNIDDINDIMY